MDSEPGFRCLGLNSAHFGLFWGSEAWICANFALFGGFRAWIFGQFWPVWGVQGLDLACLTGVRAWIWAILACSRVWGLNLGHFGLFWGSGPGFGNEEIRKFSHISDIGPMVF